MDISLKIIFFFLFFFSCVTGDKDFTKVKIDKSKFLFSNSKLIQTHEKNLEVEAMLFSDRTTTNFENLMELLKVTISPDNQKLAFEMIDREFYMVYYHFRNLSDKNLKIDVNKYKFLLDDKILDPIFPEKIKDGHYILNLRGTIKNIYNLSVFSIVAGYIVAAIAVCVKEDKCEHVEKSLETAKLVSNLGEKNSEDAISLPYHEYLLDFENDLQPNLILKPKEEKTGILFYERDNEMIHTTLKLIQLDSNKKIELKVFK